MAVDDVRRDGVTEEGFEPIAIHTSRGEVEGRYYASPGSTCGAIFVGGAGGGFDTPVRGWLYPRLCKELQSDGIACLPTADPSRSAVLLLVREDARLEQVVRQLAKLVDVLEIQRESAGVEAFTAVAAALGIVGGS